MATDMRGFTLMELLVSLALTGTVLLVAHALLGGVLDAGLRARTESERITVTGNRFDWLDRAFAGLITSDRPLRGFRGEREVVDGRARTTLEFSAWLRGPSGLAERSVHITQVGEQLVAEVSVRGQHPDTLVLRDTIATFDADYLVEYGADARWVANWISPVSAPLAVRFRITGDGEVADTLLFFVGGRG